MAASMMVLVLNFCSLHIYLVLHCLSSRASLCHCRRRYPHFLSDRNQLLNHIHRYAPA